ncbi:MAG: hypothetical protein K6F09_03430, partial [Clostridiales bacterium]|nr:hypothetical protein [Clostridiales bacterium]
LRGFDSRRLLQKKPPYGGFFNEIRPIGRTKSPAAVKSLRGEIPLRGVWTDHISPKAKPLISPRRCRDFTTVMY